MLGRLGGETTHVVSAAAHAQLGAHGHCAAEPEDGQEDVEGQRDDGVDSEGLLDGGGDQVDEADHGEDGAEHGVVDNGGGAAVLHVDHVADERHYEQSPEELRGAQGQLEGFGEGHCGGVCCGWWC